MVLVCLQPIPRLNIPAYEWWSEGLHGIASSPGVLYSDAVPASTSFPQVITTAASFNTSLYAAIGAAVGLEGRAMAKCVGALRGRLQCPASLWLWGTTHVPCAPCAV